MRTEVFELGFIALEGGALVVELRLELFPLPLVPLVQGLPLVFQLLYALGLGLQLFFIALVPHVESALLLFIFLVFEYGGLKGFALLLEEAVETFELA